MQATTNLHCTECNFKSNDKHSFEAHGKNHKNNQLKCSKCEDIFKTESELKFHSNYEHREQFQWN